MNELLSVLERFIDAVEVLGIRYVVVGGFAIAAWGRTRTTEDIEVIVELEGAQAARFVASLRSRNLLAAGDDVNDALREKGHFSIFDTESRYHIDARGAYSEKEARTLESRVYTEFLGIRLPVSGLEDTIANKLLSGREQDIEDALSVMVRNWQNIDWPRLEKLCSRYGVGRDLKSVQRKASRARFPRKERHLHHRHR